MQCQHRVHTWNALRQKLRSCARLVADGGAWSPCQARPLPQASRVRLQADAAADKAASHARRDQLLAIQRAAQARWAEAKVFEADAPEGGQPVPEGKFFANFPYPYMNGVLHLGHAFSISKCEFACAFHRLCGKRVLFPQGFHCTGAPPTPPAAVPPRHTRAARA